MSHDVEVRAPGAEDGVVVRMDGVEVSFFRADDMEPLAIVSRPVTDDIRFVLSQDKQGQSSKPDFDFVNMGLLFPQDDATEIAYLIRQLPHALFMATAFQPHIHYVQDEAEVPVWKFDYRININGADPGGSFTTLTSNGAAFTYTSGSILQIATFPEIAALPAMTVSAFFEGRLYRDDDVVSGDVLAKGFDLHAQFDALGSVEEYVK